MAAAYRILGGTADVRAYAAGRVEEVRMTTNAWWIVGAFCVAFVFFLVALHVIIFPGALVLIIVYEEVKPRRGVAVTNTAVVEFRVGGWRAMPQAVMAATDFGVLDQRRVGRVGNKVRLTFGSQSIVLREGDYTGLLAAAPRPAVPPPPSQQATPVVPAPPSAFGLPSIPPPPSSYPPPTAPSSSVQALTFPPSGPAPTEEDIRFHAQLRRVSGVVTLAGAVLILLSCILPWLVAATTESSVGVSLMKGGANPIPIAITLVAFVLAAGYLGGSRWVRPWFFIVLGCLSLIGWALSMHRLGTILDEARQHVAPWVRVHGGIGPWVYLLGALALIGGGIWGTVLRRRRPHVLHEAGGSAGAWALGVLTGILIMLLLLANVGDAAPSTGTSAAAGPPTPSPGAVALGPVPPPAHSGIRDATTYQADVAHDGNATNAGVTLPLTQSWSRALAGRVSYPVIAGGRVFVSVASGMEGYKTGQTIIALDVNTGRTIWSHHVVEDSTGFLGLSYDAGSVFAMSSGGQVIAYAAATGAQEWQRSLPFRQPSDSPPLAWGGQLYVQTNGWLFALHERTGKIAWYQQVNGGDAGSPALAGERVLAGYPCQAYAFAAHDGAQLWHDDKGCSGGGGVTAAAYGDRVYTNDGGRSWVRDAATGGVLGRTTSQQIPALDGDTGYFMKGPKLVAISLARMKPRWEFKGDGTLVGVPLVVSDTVYIGSSKGHLYALNADGRLANTIDLGAPVYWPHGPSSTTPTGMNAGDGVLAVAASDRLVVFR